MGLETIIGLAALVMAAIAGAFGIGHSRGTSKAEAKADQQRTEDNAAATVAAAKRRVFFAFTTRQSRIPRRKSSPQAATSQNLSRSRCGGRGRSMARGRMN
ncbi:hypothetical protein [Enterobacter ludwigii]|uniref:hypothetical protein n=1 Tax=Enterobacter ludwigii TaxID=299767 RepID=UPI001E381CDB|nr:hypothetical protein [Enterobacter ludwigii]